MNYGREREREGVSVTARVIINLYFFLNHLGRERDDLLLSWIKIFNYPRKFNKFFIMLCMILIRNLTFLFWFCVFFCIILHACYNLYSLSHCYKLYSLSHLVFAISSAFTYTKPYAMPFSASSVLRTFVCTICCFCTYLC